MRRQETVLEDCRSPKRIHCQGTQVPGRHGFPHERLRQTRNPKATELEDSETNRHVIAIWEKKVSAYCTRTDYLDSNLKTAYAVIWGLCSEAMKAKLTSLDDFETKKEIRGITYRFEGQRYIYLSLDNARITYYAHTLGAKDLISCYPEHFRSLVEVLEHYGGAIGEDPGLLDANAAVSANADDTSKRLKIARDRTLALAFLKRANRRRFGALWADLGNQFSEGNDQYPTDLTAAYNLLVNFKPPKREEPRRNTRSQEPAVKEEDGMTFVQSGEVVAGADSVTHTGVTWFRCEHKGHYTDKCPNGPNATLLQISSLVGDIKNFGTVWYHPDSLANIFSLTAVCKLCRITMDTSVEAALCVHRSDGSIMKFIEYGSGLYYKDAAAAV